MDIHLYGGGIKDDKWNKTNNDKMHRVANKTDIIR